MQNKRLLALGAVALFFASATAVHATTEITGSHNNQLDGYDATSGSYDVPADSGGVPSATFDDNGGYGLNVTGSNTSVTVEGGQFDGNFDTGLNDEAGGTLTVTGGVFDDNGDEGIFADTSSVVTVSGGEFLDNYAGLVGAGGTTNLYGGQFGGNTEADLVDDVNVYGAFAGVADGKTIILPPSDSGSSSFYGQLEDNSTAQTYTYFQGPITLHGTGTLLPEPAMLGLMALAGPAVSARRRRRR